MAKIKLNGKKIILNNKQKTVFELLKKYNISNKKVAIELNGKILQKSKIKSVKLKNLDELEIVHFIGGG